MAGGNKPMQSWFEDLQRQGTGIGKLKMLMSAIEQKSEEQNCWEHEGEKWGIDEIIVNNEKSPESQKADSEDFKEEK